MENFGYDVITEELQDLHRISLNLDTLAPPIPQLEGVWQWDQTETGMLFFEKQESLLSRYVPPSFTSGTVPRSLDQTITVFVKGMQRNNDTFTISTRGEQGSQIRRDLLRRLLVCDIKKLHIAREYGRLVFRKTEDDLLPYSEQLPEVALRISHENGRPKNPDELIAEMNVDARYDWYGPGSYWCRDPGCLVTGPCMSRTPVVLWGPRENQVLHLRKRFTCASNNVVYCVHCRQCLTEGRFSMCVGQSEKTTGSIGRNIQNLHSRLSNHLTALNNPWNRERYAGQDVSQLVAGMIHRGEPDPHFLRQDPYCHFNYQHSPSDRIITIIDRGFPNLTNRLHHENYYQRHIGSWEYYWQFGSGSLNLF